MIRTTPHIDVVGQAQVKLSAHFAEISPHHGRLVKCEASDVL